MAELDQVQASAGLSQASKYSAIERESNPLKLVPAKFSYDSSDPLALLTEMPVFEELKSLEQNLIQEVRHQRVLGSVDSNFIDIKDAEFINEGKLTVINSLQPEQQAVLKFGVALLNHLCDKLDLEETEICIASSLCETNMGDNAFRNSYFYDSARKTVFIRHTRLSTAGDLALVLVHFAAHLRAQSFDNDGDVSFLTWFFKSLKILAEITFRNVKSESARMKAGRDLIRIRSLLPTKVNFPSHMIIPNLSIDDHDRKLQPEVISSEIKDVSEMMDQDQNLNRLLVIESELNIQEHV